MDARKIAAELQQITYRSHKSCKKGHEPVRYVSTGQCVACLKAYTSQYRGIARSVKQREEDMKFQQMAQVTIWAKRKHIVVTNAFAEIMLADDRRIDILMSFMLLINRSTLTRDEVLSMVTLDHRGMITSHHPARDNDAGVYEIELRGDWYVFNEVAQCARGERATVERMPS